MVRQRQRIVVSFLVSLLLIVSELGLFTFTSGSHTVHATNTSGWTADCDGHGSPVYIWNGVPGGLQVCAGTGRLAETFGGLLATGNFDEFQCTELVARYMWMKFGFPSLDHADGANIVDAYSNAHPGTLHRIYNDHRVQIMKIAPDIGDVISFTYIHTAIVINSSVDSSGTGDLTLIEQNYPTGSAGFTRKIGVHGWLIDASANVKDWMTTRYSPGYPGGWWTDQVNDSNPPTHVRLSFHAARNGESQVSSVKFTEYTPSSGTWTVKQEVSASDGAIVSVDLDLSEPTVVGADVYSPDGNYQLSPSGLRKLCLGGNCAPIQAIAYDPVNGPNIGGGGSGQPSSSCTAGSNQVVLFIDPNYAGGCVVKNIGAYTDPNAIGLPNDSISSIKIGGGAKAELCRDSGLSNTCEWFDQDAPDLSTHSVGVDQVSSVQVVGGQPTTGCVPNPDQVAFYVDENYGGLCVSKDIGDYLDPGSIGLPNDSISSLRVGDRVKLEACRDAGLSNTCEWFVNDQSTLADNSINVDTISSAHVESRGGIELCDGQNYGGPCMLFGPGKYNMSDYGFSDRTESIHYLDGYGGLYHTVLFAEANQTGNLAHYDDSAPTLDGSFSNHVRSIEIYKHTPPNTALQTPANATVFPPATTGLDLTFDGGSQFDVHVWSANYNLDSGWISSKTLHLSGLIPGQYSWQAQSQNQFGIGQWSDIWTFTVTGPPLIIANSVTLSEGVSTNVQVQGTDPANLSLTLTASSLPSFATFTDNGNGAGTLSLHPNPGDAGTYTVTVTANDGTASGSSGIAITVTSSSASSDCPSPWNCADIDNPNLAGDQSLNSDTWTVHGAGGDIWGTADQFHYVWQTLPGDGSLSAQVLSQDNTDSWAKAGVMFRQTSDRDSAYYAVEVTPGNGVVVQYRTDQGVNAQMNAQMSGSAPVYLKAVRTGNVFTAAISTDGVTWTAVAGSSATLNVNGTMLTGLAVASHSAALGAVAFNSVNLAPTTPLPTNCPAPWTCGDIGNPDLAGSQVLDNNTWTVRGAGNDIWEASDQFRYVWQSLSGDGSISTQVLSQTNTSDWAKAGVMFRQDTSTDSAFYLVALTPSNGLTVQYRTDQGVNAQMNVQISGTAPMYVQAVRTGNSFTAFLSGDGVTWTSIDNSTVTLNVTGSMLAGLEVGSVNGGTLSIATFDAVTLTAGSTPTPTPTPTVTPTPTATPAPSVELLPSPWNLTGNNGASELYQSCDPGILAGKTTVRITYNLHGLQALGGDASAIIIDQNGWHYISLSDYGQNGLDGSQTVDIPLSAFSGLDLTQPIDGTIHTRFWYGSQFTVDITSIIIF